MDQRLNWRVGFWGLACLALLAPLAAMQMTETVNWGAGDFLLAAVLLGGVGLGLEVAVRTLHSPLQRALAVAGVTMIAALIWIELAVGIFH